MPKTTYINMTQLILTTLKVKDGSMIVLFNTLTNKVEKISTLYATVKKGDLDAFLVDALDGYTGCKIVVVERYNTRYIQNYMNILQIPGEVTTGKLEAVQSEVKSLKALTNTSVTRSAAQTIINKFNALSDK